MEKRQESIHIALMIWYHPHEREYSLWQRQSAFQPYLAYYVANVYRALWLLHSPARSLLHVIMMDYSLHRLLPIYDRHPRIGVNFAILEALPHPGEKYLHFFKGPP